MTECSSPVPPLLAGLLAGLSRPLAGVVHIGAGEGGELPAFLGTACASILLVEADPEQAAALEQAADDPRIKVVQAAVSGDPAPRPFFRLNLAEMSALRTPSALRDLFPGLRILSQEKVTPADPATLLRPWLAGAGSRCLVLETPGEVLGILKALDAAGLLHSFDGIALRESVEPLYAQAEPLERIQAFLSEGSFHVEREAGPPEPERPWICARLNRASLAQQGEMDTLRSELQAATSWAEEERIARQEAERRLCQARDEILKAEGQIRLLRDILVNGPGL